MFFRTPSIILVAGPSGSGKTVFVSKLLQQPSHYFQGLPLNVHYCYGSWQHAFETLQKKGLNSMKGYPNVKTWRPGLAKRKEDCW